MENQVFPDYIKEWTPECINMSQVWLMIPIRLGRSGVSFMMMDPVSCDKYYVKNTHLLISSHCDARVCGYSNGWLLAYTYNSVNGSNKVEVKLNLYNPITKSIVSLPGEPEYRQLVLTCSTDSPNCTVFGISQQMSEFSSVQLDWNDDDSVERRLNLGDIEREDNNVRGIMDVLVQSDRTPACIKGDFYFLVKGRGDLASFVRNKEKNNYLYRIHRLKTPCNDVYVQRFIVAGYKDNTILSVYIKDFKWLRVFEFDRLKEDEWLEVEDLENHNVYLSLTSCICSKEAVFPAKGNRIYLTKFLDTGMNEIIYYSMDTRKFHAGEGDSSVVLDGHCSSTQPLPNLWFEPSLLL